NENDPLTFMRARYYSPPLGRFLSNDPLGLASGQVNLYGYAGQNPVNFIDPSGLFFKHGLGTCLEYIIDVNKQAYRYISGLLAPAIPYVAKKGAEIAKKIAEYRVFKPAPNIIKDPLVEFTSETAVSAAEAEATTGGAGAAEAGAAAGGVALAEAVGVGVL